MCQDVVFCYGWYARTELELRQASVYSVGQERNQCTFQNKFRSEDVLLRDLENYVWGRTWNWKVVRSFNNWFVCNSRVLMIEF